MDLFLHYAALTALLSTAPAFAMSLPDVKSILIARQSNSNGIYDNGGDGQGVNTNAGASGSSGGFQLSIGGLVAIIVVVVAVVIFGVATTALFVIAKRRQLTMRETMRRASRRLTGRDRADAVESRKSKRAGIQLGDSTPAMKSYKRGLVVQVDDMEARRPKSGRPKSEKRSAKPGWTDKWLGSGRPSQIA